MQTYSLWIDEIILLFYPYILVTFEADRIFLQLVQ